jgi:hypothetical protein
MPKLLSTTALTTVLSAGVSFALASSAVAASYDIIGPVVNGETISNQYTVINLAGSGSPVSLEIINSDISSGVDTVITGDANNGEITSAALNTLTFNGNNLLYSTRQVNDSTDVGAKITLNADNLNVTGSAGSFVTEFRIDYYAGSGITLNTDNLNISNSTLLLTANNTAVNATDKITMNNGAVLSLGQVGSTITSHIINATNGYDFYENTLIENLSNNYAILGGGQLHAITSGVLNTYAKFSGKVQVGDINIDTGSTMAFDDVIFTFNVLTDKGTLDLTGPAVFQQAMNFDDGGTTNIHDAEVTFIVPTVNVTTSKMIFSGSNTVNVATSGSGSLGLALDSDDSLLKVLNGETTINGKTTLTKGTVNVDAGTLNLTDFHYDNDSGLITLGSSATLNFTADAALNHSTSFTKGTVGLTGGSTVQLGSGADMNFTNATLSMRGINNQITSSAGANINIGEGATLSVSAPSSSSSSSGSLTGGSASASTTTSSAFITTDGALNISGGALEIASGAVLTVKNLNYQTSGSGVASSFSNSGSLVLTGTGNFIQPVNFSSGMITLNNATLAAADSTFSGAQLYLKGDNNVSETFNMTGGNIVAEGTGSVTFNKDAVINADLTIPTGYTVNALGGFGHSGRLSNTGLLVLNGQSSFAQGITLNSGVLRLANSADVNFVQPSVLTSGGVLEVADNTSAAIRGTLNMDGGEIRLGATDSSLKLFGNSTLSGTTKVYQGTGSAGSGKLTLGNGAYMTIPSGAVLNASLDMEPGSYLNVGVTGTAASPTAGQITGALVGTGTGTDAATISLTLPASLVQNETTQIKIANSNSGNLAFDNNNLLYSFGWVDGNIGTVGVAKKSTAEVRNSLMASGSSYNQSETISGTLAGALEANTVLSGIADAFSADVQSGNIANANKNADLLNNNQAPLALATSLSNTGKIYSAVSSRFLSSSNRERRKKERALKARSLGQNGNNNPYMQDYYRKKNMQQSYNNLFQDEIVVSSYVDELSGKAAGDIVSGRSSLWVEALYSKGKIDKKNRIPGFDLTGYGAAIGFDYALSDVKLGIGYAYTHNKAESTGRDTKINGHTGFLYGEYMPNNWYINAMLSYTFSSYKETKHPYGYNIKSKFDGNAFAAEARTGYSMGHWAPELGVRFINATIDDYTDSAGQKNKIDDATVWTALAGIKGSIGDIFNWRLAATYDLSQSKAKTVVVLPNNVSYNLKGAEMKKLGAELGISFDLNFFAISYEGVLRDGYRNHTGLVQFRYQW